MILQWVKRALVWIIKDIFNDIREFISAMFVLFALIGGFYLDFKFMLLFAALIVVLYSLEIWRFLKARMNNKNKH
jgi:hypothetical protein